MYLYDRTSAKLYGICLRILGSEAEAEEALQETMGGAGTIRKSASTIPAVARPTLQGTPACLEIIATSERSAE